MKKTLTIVAIAAIASAALAQAFWMSGPSQVQPIDAKLDGSVKQLAFADGSMATLYKANDVAYFGIDATFASSPARASSFVVCLNAAAKSDYPAFSHFEVFDFSIKEWIEVGASKPNTEGRPSPTWSPTLTSESLSVRRFSHPVTGEIWARAIWGAKDLEVVAIDQFAVMYAR